ncbi:GNAT family N-acetyltransferase [Flavobacterium sp.]|uniref:GNAT family N-acetyltransferase n=1 Tax=Flavobacterium sp. TaxID=239 RepID=UPI00121279B0|nr:GNAT family N-acetyltransferase [Flavobacterium sp.]RZJ73959.1 MAG: N-acetyltransferase [Flavobacterium sp.]
MEITKNESQSQYELHLEGGKIAFVEYSVKDDKIYLTHTEVPKSVQGQGVGQKLIAQTLQSIKKEGKTLVPLCAFVSWYVNNHKEWHSLLSEGYQM